MAPLLSPKHGARNDRPLSGDMHGGDRGCPVTRDGRTRPRQGREGLGPGRVRRTPRGRTARTRLWALTLDRGVPSPAPGGKVTHSLHGRLCSADAQGEGAAGREGPRPPATSHVGEAMPSCRGGRAPGLRPAWGHRPLERDPGLPVSRGTTTVSGLPAKQCARGGCGGRRGRAGRVRTPRTAPCRRARASGRGRRGCRARESRGGRADAFLILARHHGSFPSGRRKLGTALVLMSRGRGRTQGRQRAATCPARTLGGGQKRGPRGGSHTPP